jgi:hypothetical protein
VVSGSEPSIWGGQVAEIYRSCELGGSRGESPKVGYSRLRKAKYEVEHKEHVEESQVGPME